MKRHYRLRTAWITLLSMLLTGCANAGGPAAPPAEKMPYGVFLGVSGEEPDLLGGYELVVIEPEEFTAEQIAGFHGNGQQVYGYLSVGSLENYRSYYERFEYLALGDYENWPDEKWADVSAPEWQDYLSGTLGPQIAALGVDGFFIDNCDVYYHYPTDEIFDGLVNCLKDLRTATGLPLLINGGDTFVTRCLEEGTVSFDGINQETVFTSIDFDRESYSRQEPEENEYFRDYLERVKAAGLTVYLLEYHADAKLSAEIEEYCARNGFEWFNSASLELTGAYRP